MVVYFFDGEVLAPEYRTLTSGDPQRRFVELLASGPHNKGLTNAWPDDAPFERGGETASKGGEALVFGLGESFWKGPDRVVYQRTAQLMFTAASLEAGKQVVLLRRGVPARSVRPDGSKMDLYLERDDFADVRPWIQIAQPVAGATVGRTIPVSFTTRSDRVVRARVVVDDEVAVSTRLRAPGESLRIARTRAPEAVLFLSQGGYEVAVPLLLAAR